MVGDIIYLFEGMQIPVDGFVVEAEELTVDVYCPYINIKGKFNNW